MKVVHIIAGLGDGGAEGVLFRLCTFERTNRHTVISLLDEGKYGPLLRAAGLTVHCLGMKRTRVTLRQIFTLLRLIRRERPDLVQTWMYHGNLIGGVIGRLAGVKHICWGMRTSPMDPQQTPKSTILAARLGAWLSGIVPSRIVSCSSQSALVHQGLGYDKNKFVIVPNGYDLVRFKPDVQSRQDLRARLGVSPNEPLIGMVARFHPQKDLANLIASLALAYRSGARFRCALVGAGFTEQNEDLIEILERNAMREIVLLVGQRSDVPAVMNALDIHILSSAFGEAFPNVLAEAMACGTPCVTTDVGDAAFILGNTGWVVPPRNAKLLADAIVSAVEASRDTRAWETRREAARRRISENFDLQGMCEAYKTIWTLTVNGKNL